MGRSDKSILSFITRAVSFAPLVLTLAACAGGSSKGALAPDDDARCAEMDADECAELRGSSELPRREASTQALPRYFTLELLGGETRIDGQRVVGADLRTRIQHEASDERNGGAVVRLAHNFSGEVLGAVVWELATAGFDHIIVSKNVLTSENMNLKPAGVESEAVEVPPQASVDAVDSEPTEAPREAETAALASDVNVRTIGLHVGGGPNDDATRAKFISPIEERFGELRQCHALAKNQQRNASVGVDLLIQNRGGKAKIQDFRTALSGEEFEACVRDVLLKVDFPTIQRPTVVSYSMLFEPAKR